MNPTEQAAALRLFQRFWTDYCYTGDDMPTWEEWQIELGKLMNRSSFKMKPIPYSLRVAYGRT